MGCMASERGCVCKPLPPTCRLKTEAEGVVRDDKAGCMGESIALTPLDDCHGRASEEGEGGEEGAGEVR